MSELIPEYIRTNSSSNCGRGTVGRTRYFYPTPAISRNHRRIFMQDKLCKLSRLAAVLLVFLAACVGSAWASGVPWQVGDIVVCYGGGNCNVIRLHGSTVQVLDTISSGLLGHNSGVGLNNTLHVLATDDGTGTTHSNVVVYSIASINPFNPSVNPLTHTPISTFDGSGGGSGKAAAVAVGTAGHIFVGNTSPASLVELDSKGNPVTGSSYSFTTGECATNVLNSVDLSAAGDSIYVTAGDGIIRKVSLVLSGGTYTLAGATCAKFADFGSLVNLYGIKDIPALALGSVSPNCNGTSCPAGESILVVAKGFTDPDDATTNETGEPPSPNDPDAVNICTNLMDQTPVSCGLLLDTAGAGLNAQPWLAGNLYSSTNTTILDPHGHVQQVSHPGTSGSDEPTFDQSGGITDDNLVIWTNQGHTPWQPTHLYTSGNMAVDPAGHVQQASDGLSAATEPSPWTDSSPPNFGGITHDGVKWMDQGSFAWQPTHSYVVPGGPTDPTGIVVDSNGHIQKVITPGTSGTAAPAFTSNSPLPGETLDGLTWTNMGQTGNPQPWTPNTLYSVIGTKVLDSNGNVEQVATTGTSGPGAAPAGGWNTNLNGTTIDNAVIWSDQGGWQLNHPYSVGDTAGDTSSHLWQVTIAGTSAGTIPAFTANDLPGSGVVYENNAVTWTDLGAWQASHAYTQGAPVGDTGRYLWQETNTKGTSAPAANAPDFTS
ncbi:MAG TPA: hypothetical protein VL155_15510, partial [Terriglobales bacterium]|nr:hypothetical protein [Terriglobales bacterium]